MPIITLTTDFGIKDGHPGAMKGVILGILPGAQIVDISHNIQPQNIMECALLLARVTPYFPAGSIHVAVVDPGVGSSRLPIAGRIGEHYYVGPNNGVFTLLEERAEQNGETMEWVRLDQPRYWLPKVSNVFHGRDVFAPSAAHLGRGVPLGELGSALGESVRLHIPRPQATAFGLRTEIMHIDHFGNIYISAHRNDVAENSDVCVRLCGVEINGLVNTFSDGTPDELVALFGSSESLLVCKVNGNAAQQLRAAVGDPVDILVSPSKMRQAA